MRLVLLPFKVIGFVVGVAVLGAGIPLVWVWIASQLADTFLKVQLLPLFVMVAGLVLIRRRRQIHGNMKPGTRSKGEARQQVTAGAGE